MIYIRQFILILTLLSSTAFISLAQPDSVDVTFYFAPFHSPPQVFLRGEFNQWGQTSMSFDEESDRWFATVRLRVGGPHPLPAQHSIPGAYQYKFYYTFAGQEYWLQDPLNPRINPLDHDNSYLYITDPTIYQLLPNSMSGIVGTRYPIISAYVYPSTQTEIDADGFKIEISDYVFTDLGDYFDHDKNYFEFQLPERLSNGTHILKFTAASLNGSVSVDSTEFIVDAGFVRLLTRSNPNHIRPTHTIDGIVEDETITEAILYHNGSPITIDVTEGVFSYEVTLSEGENVFYVEVDVPDIDDNISDPIDIVYVIDRKPKPKIVGEIVDGHILLSTLNLNENSYPVDSHIWNSDDERNPSPLNISEYEGETIFFEIPEIPGEYYIDVRTAAVNGANNPSSGYSNVSGDNENGWIGRGRVGIRVYENGSAEILGVEQNPSWVRDAIVYEIYIPAFGPAGGGTFQHIINHLPELKDLGVNVLWFTPIYENNEGINELNAGYNIADFYSVHPQFGTMNNFDALISQAHEMGIRIILDSTPNHVGRLHPWIDDLILYRDYSIYRPLIENRLLGNPRDLGHSIFRLEDGYPLYARYSNWTLPNLNYENPETFEYMMEMYRWWVTEKNIDGYRMDVYWGPENRYGKNLWWKPFREEIKRVRPDIFILGETDGTGPGSENNYADMGGASDAAYDWSLYGYIKTVLTGSGGGTIAELHNRVNNFAPSGERYNYHTGPNAHYFRFIENHDETRVAQLYGAAKSRAGAVLILTAPGIPMIYAGQEVGETSRRGTINWNRQIAQEQRDYYKRLTYSRNEFPAFRSDSIRRVSSGQGRVYSYSRPYEDQNGIVAINFSNQTVTAVLQIGDDHVTVSTDSLLSDKNYYLNDVLNDSSIVVTKSDLSLYEVTLGPWESVVYVLADTLIKLVTNVTDKSIEPLPNSFKLYQNYPNPFNPTTTIRYEIPQDSEVRLVVYDILGREVKMLIDGFQRAGSHTKLFDASQLSSGIYFYRIDAGSFIDVKRMIFLK